MMATTFSTKGDVGILTLNNPPLNLWDLGFLADWKTAVDQAYRSDIRALIVRAEGLIFWVVPT
jgi:enoyl-CoA hydratase/carnithine racemase